MDVATVTFYDSVSFLASLLLVVAFIREAPITQLRMRVIKIVTFKGGHLMR